MKPRVFLAQRQGFDRFTSPQRSFMKLCRSRRARASRWRKFSRLTLSSSAPDGISHFEGAANGRDLNISSDEL
jgi:hypothetical protein